METKNLPEWAVEAHKRGESVLIDHEIVHSPTRAELITDAQANYAEIAEQFKGEQEQLYKQLEGKDAEIQQLKAELAKKSAPAK